MAVERHRDAAATRAGAALDDAVVEELRWLETHSPEGIVADLVESFLHDARGTLATLRDAVQRGDGPTAARGAHRLKGSAGAVGAVEVARLAADLEAAAMTGSLQSASEGVASLAAALAVAERALRDLAADSKPASRGSGP